MTSAHQTIVALGLAALGLSAPQANGQNPPARAAKIPVSARIELRSPNPQMLAQQLTREGFDAESLRWSASRVELIATPGEFDSLVARGLNPSVLELARPLYDRLAELNDLDAPPAGYKDNAQLLADMRAIEAAHPGLCKVFDAAAIWGPGGTHEGRPIWVAKISDNVLQDEDEPNVMIVSCHHCREIVTPVLAMHAIEQLTSQYATSAAIRSVVDANEIWIAPVWNPDGYNEVFVGDSYWRKNRKPYGGSIGVDLNRNYPMGWNSSCAGSTRASSSTYKGPSAASEAETQTMLGITRARRFEKVLDFHSSGREVLYGYRCSTFPLQSWYAGEAAALASAAHYSGATRVPSAEGEHYQWQLQEGGAYAFLTETHTSFQPPYSSAQSEAVWIFDEILHFLQRPVPLTGHVRDAQTGEPIEASIAVAGLGFQHGETRSSGGSFGRYFYWAGAGTQQVSFSAPGYHSETIAVNFGAGTITREIDLRPVVDIRSSAPLRIGTSAAFNLFAPNDAGRLYLGIPSLTSAPAISLGNRMLHGAIDVLTQLAYMVPFITNLTGTLNVLGGGSMTVVIPQDPYIVGMPFVLNYITLDASGSIVHVSNPPYIGALVN